MRYTARVLAGAMIAAGAALPVQADEDKFTAADVLAWEEKNQDSFFETSISMAGVLAVQAENPAGKCINDWYFKSEAATQAANDQIRAVMREYSGYYPGTVIVAVIERECGDLTPSN